MNNLSTIVTQLNSKVIRVNFNNSYITILKRLHFKVIKILK